MGPGATAAGALQPYGQGPSTGGAMPGQSRERSGNAEITPLEVNNDEHNMCDENGH